eukprot:Blabericola_migrator_1__13535@NODE_98_length_14373_cov_122_493220_g88_i0_p3_GENE_NODE_98_length_14373_cov_122_493220_g88_i0NODE_98_length_14373_cov_122_493220_g88_i0_p3_ORF_typecomplete_len520_score105_93zfHC3/PF16827_5/0_55zfHC3/PF16827_5/4_4e02DZR/PF12773_7/1_2DZR/PF12773_7/62_NODE_98_length_14373_cov_122_493220_g88_i068858444
MSSEENTFSFVVDKSDALDAIFVTLKDAVCEAHKSIRSLLTHSEDTGRIIQLEKSLEVERSKVRELGKWKANWEAKLAAAQREAARVKEEITDGIATPKDTAPSLHEISTHSEDSHIGDLGDSSRTGFVGSDTGECDAIRVVDTPGASDTPGIVNTPSDDTPLPDTPLDETVKINTTSSDVQQDQGSHTEVDTPHSETSTSSTQQDERDVIWDVSAILPELLEDPEAMPLDLADLPIDVTLDFENLCPELQAALAALPEEPVYKEWSNSQLSMGHFRFLIQHMSRSQLLYKVLEGTWRGLEGRLQYLKSARALIHTVCGARVIPQSANKKGKRLTKHTCSACRFTVHDTQRLSDSQVANEFAQVSDRRHFDTSYDPTPEETQTLIHTISSRRGRERLLAIIATLMPASCDWTWVGPRCEWCRVGACNLVYGTARVCFYCGAALRNGRFGNSFCPPEVARRFPADWDVRPDGEDLLEISDSSPKQAEGSDEDGSQRRRKRLRPKLGANTPIRSLRSKTAR